MLLSIARFCQLTDGNFIKISSCFPSIFSSKRMVANFKNPLTRGLSSDFRILNKRKRKI